MGLDMYLYKATKPDIQFGIYDERDACIQNLMLIPNDEHKEDMYRSLEPFMTRIQVSEKIFNTEKIAQDYGLTGRVHISSSSRNGFTFTGENKNTGLIPVEVVEKHYTKPNIRTVFAVDVSQVYYWRKAYDVQDLIHNSLDCYIENCGYYPISDDVADAIKEIDDEFDPEIVKRESDSCIFYHEWY